MDESDERVDIEELRRAVRGIAYSTTYTRRVEKNLLSALDELERLRALEDNLPIPYKLTEENLHALKAVHDTRVKPWTKD